ncbi:DUF4159 domain-containing protein [Sulfuriroseicoccus oceanibius]|uniref:DUF4159 domain-containing protein n=1 Tax=Sulfuriroseicoccus oceanibius TaxID=2707525 RepID=A0A6B3LB52_9BACT|nr:DUF4159 domain-containing protein [Sulfuriroseicoccus oceanibius]QQL43980.1 DUF4159 domain-containing protein [Sulfuriroseicoccus oceanibius]
MRIKPLISSMLLLAVGLVPAAAKEGAVQCGNLIYAGTKTSRCFSDEFLTVVQQKTSISTERRFKPVKLSSDELFKFPFVIMTGEEDFNLTAKERENLKKYLENGGFMLASPGCSNGAWADAFRREVKRIFGADALEDIAMDHPVFNTVFKVKTLKLSHGGTGKMQGVTLNGKMVVAFASDGLNDTSNTEGCCC